MAVRPLIADDNASIRGIVRLSIESNTNWVVCGEVENGKSAVDFVQRLHPEIVILDLSMSVMHGLDAARQIAATVPNTKIVLFTLHRSEELVEQAHRVGVSAVVPKEGIGLLLSTLKELTRELVSA